MLTRRQGHETENMGSDTSYSAARTATNPQKNNAYNILAKGNIGNERHRLETCTNSITTPTIPYWQTAWVRNRAGR